MRSIAVRKIGLSDTLPLVCGSNFLKFGHYLSSPKWESILKIETKFNYLLVAQRSNVLADQSSSTYDQCFWLQFFALTCLSNIFGRIARDPWSSGHETDNPEVMSSNPSTAYQTDHFSYFFVENLYSCWKIPEVNEKEAGDGLFKMKLVSFWSTIALPVNASRTFKRCPSMTKVGLKQGLSQQKVKNDCARAKFNVFMKKMLKIKNFKNAFLFFLRFSKANTTNQVGNVGGFQCDQIG